MTARSMTDQSIMKNPAAFQCPNPNCREVLLNKHVAYAAPADFHLEQYQLPSLPEQYADSLTVSSPSFTAEACDMKDSLLLPSSPLPSWWMVDDVFSFENMGFTKILPSNVPFKKPDTNVIEAVPVEQEIDEHGADLLLGQRFLCCAACDVGPLGISVRDQEGKWKFAMDAARVASLPSPSTTPSPLSMSLLTVN